MWVTMHLHGDLNEHGVLCGIEFGDLKKSFRAYLDEHYDHRLLLNEADPFSQQLYTAKELPPNNIVTFDSGAFLPGDLLYLPGLRTVPGDPTTENIARWIGEDMLTRLASEVTMENAPTRLRVEVWETSVNMAAYEG